MIWQLPEVWEILKTMEITGIITMVSVLICFIFLICFTQGISYVRQQAKPISPKTRYVLAYTGECFKLSGRVAISSFILYDLCWFLLLTHPNVPITMP